MGACDFQLIGSGKTAGEAFDRAREEAAYDHGHCGYTGTIAEKSSFKMVSLPPETDAIDHIDALFNNEKHWINDKWGPAGCIDMGADSSGIHTYYFFGVASS